MSNQIAKTILQQIHAGTVDKRNGRYLMMCWGAKQLLNTGKGLRFKVKGLLHRGYVEVTLNEGADLYEVEFYTIRNYKAKITAEGEVVPGSQVRKTVKQYEGVYWDMLTGIIDSTVEKAA